MTNLRKAIHYFQQAIRFENSTNIGNSANRVLATIGGLKYELSDEPIKNGDLVYNEFAKEIDKCIQVFSDNSMCVQFKSGMRAVLSTRHYKRAILQ